MKLVNIQDLGAVTSVKALGGYIMKKYANTKSALRWLSIPLVYVAVFLLFAVLTAITEIPTNRDGIFLVFCVITVVMMLPFSLVLSGCSIISAVYQFKAIRNQETKIINLVMFGVSILYIIVAVIYACCLWQGMMSV